MLVIRVGVRLFHKWIADVYKLMENLKMQEYMKRIWEYARIRENMKIYATKIYSNIYNI